MNKKYRIALAIPALAISLAACGGQSGDKQGNTAAGSGNTVDECPRADGTPCR